jgi:hypothetical protein
MSSTDFYWGYIFGKQAGKDEVDPPGSGKGGIGGGFLALPIILELLCIGGLMYVYVSGSASYVTGGLYLHPILGVAAALATLAVYFYLYSYFLSALALSLVASFFWGSIVFSASMLVRCGAYLFLRKLPSVLHWVRHPLDFVGAMIATFVWIAGISIIVGGLLSLQWSHPTSAANAHGPTYNFSGFWKAISKAPPYTHTCVRYAKQTFPNDRNRLIDTLMRCQSRHGVTGSSSPSAVIFSPASRALGVRSRLLLQRL